MKRITTNFSCWWRGPYSASRLCCGFSHACISTDYRPRVVGNSSGMRRFRSPLCWDVREFCSIVSWILICRYQRMLLCSMCFADWPFRRTRLNYPRTVSFGPAGLQALETWRTASNKRAAVASVAELNSESAQLKAVGNADSYVIIVLTAITGIYMQGGNSGIEIASLETKSKGMPIPNI